MKAVALALLAATTAHATTLHLWHAYRGGEEQALIESTKLFTQKTGIDVELLAIPHDAFSTKLQAAIPHGNGPDVFIFAHDRVQLFRDEGLIAPSDGSLDPAAYLPNAVDALRLDGKTYGYPLSINCVALYLNTDLVQSAPETTDAWVAMLKSLSHPDQNHFGMAYQSWEPYYMGPFLFGFGAQLFDASGRASFDTPGASRAFAFVRSLQDQRLIPQEASGGLVKSLFNDRRAAMVISGPWFAGEIAPDIHYRVVPLPKVAATDHPLQPFLGVETAFVSPRSTDPADAQALARFLTLGEATLLRVRLGRQIPAELAAYERPEVQRDALISAFRSAAKDAVPMPNTLEMARVWEPLKLALRATMQGTVPPEQAGALAERRYRALYRPKPPNTSPIPYLVALAGAAVAYAAWQWRRRSREPFAKRYPDWRRAIGYVAPAAAGVLMLVLVPLGFGVGVAFFHHDSGHYSFVGLGNFIDILASRGYRIAEPLSFYFALVITVLWTVVNVALHVSIGLFLAILLKDPLLRLRGVFRVLLIVPWAVPNYITALMWKGMFHRQFGAINGLLAMIGIEPISWFTRFSTAFAANVVTNTWLGFPFMMVVALGALQSIPQDLYEAAEVDGASRWVQFRRITLPLLRPALLPAVILGGVWTFNMFNIIYLVSGGEPGGATDILVSEAYRWAFERNEQYGFAAAYSLLIFFVLLGYSAFTKRLARANEELLA